MDPKNTDFQSMMSSFMQNAQNAQKMQENLRNVYQDITEKHKDITVEGKAGGDLVKVQVNLKMQVTHTELKSELFNEKPEVIAELITSAVNQGIHAAQQAMKQQMLEVTKKMGIPPEFPLPFSGK